MTCLQDLVCKFSYGLLVFVMPLSAAYNIGDYAEGGVIFWLTSDRQHGLVCALSDITVDELSNFQWSKDGAVETIGAKADGLPLGWNTGITATGLINTNLIVARYGSGLYAAKLCSDYSVTVGDKTYNDWYLPSLEELGLMMARKGVINTTALSNGGAVFQADIYWSSLEYDAFSTQALNFSSALANGNNKDLAYRVRAVRAF